MYCNGVSRGHFKKLLMGNIKQNSHAARHNQNENEKMSINKKKISVLNKQNLIYI